MKKLALIFIITLFCLNALAQSTQSELKHFAKDDLSFDYPDGWTLTDKSTLQAQHLIFARPGGSELIMIIAYRDPATTFAQFRAAYDGSTAPYIESVAQKFGSAGKPTEREALCAEIGTFKTVAGIRLRGSFNQQPSTGEIYSFLMGQRFVNLMFIRMDKDAAQGDPVWEIVRHSLKIESANPTPEQEEYSAGWLGSNSASGEVLNGKAISLPKPDYPKLAKAAHVAGTVVVEVTIDERGEVTSTRAVSGPSLLRPPGEEAAKGAKFPQTFVCGKPVKVTGVITYNFVAM